MDLPAIPEIRVETAGNEVTYWLPVRPLGKIRLLGLIPVGFSALWLFAAGHPILDVVLQFSKSGESGFELLMIVFLVGFVVTGCVPAFYGLLVMFGRCRVRWRDGRLTVSDSVGPFGWRRRMPRAAIRKFEVKKEGVSSNGQTVTTGPLAAMATLMAEFEKGKPRIVALGYPREWLEAIARDLSGRAGRSQAAPPQIEVTDEREKPPRFQDVAQQPADSKWSCNDTARTL